MKKLKTDILILGAGGAGMFAALHAHHANPKLSIVVAVKGLLGQCGCTRMVQGGYNVALAAGDSVEQHFIDTIEGGKWLPDQDLAWTLVETAVDRILELENESAVFSTAIQTAPSTRNRSRARPSTAPFTKAT